MKLKYIVVYENNSDKLDIGPCPVYLDRARKQRFSSFCTFDIYKQSLILSHLSDPMQGRIG